MGKTPSVPCEVGAGNGLEGAALLEPNRAMMEELDILELSTATAGAADAGPDTYGRKVFL